MVIEGWYAWQMNKKEMQNLPSNTNLIMQQYGLRGNNAVNDTDPRIVLTEYYLLDSIPSDQKDYQVYEEPDHRYPYGDRDYTEMQVILKPLDALMEYTFKGTASAHDIALEQGSDNPYKQGSDDAIQEVSPIDSYGAKCSDSAEANALIDYCTMRQFVKIDTNDSIAKPAYLTSYIEPQFDTNVTRITDRANQTGNAHPYPKQGSAWNSDGTIIRMKYRLYDAKSFSELAITSGLTNGQANSKLGSPKSAAAGLRWSKSNPNLIYLLNGDGVFKELTLNADKTDISESTLIDIGALGYERVDIGPGEGNFDYQDRFIVFAAKKSNDDKVYAVLYNRESNSILWEKEAMHGLWSAENNSSDPDYFDWISVDASGEYILLAAESKRFLYDINLSNEKILIGDGDGGHGDMGIDVHGDPVYVQMLWGGRGIWSHNLKTLKPTKLLDSNYGGGHVSCRNYLRPGWCYVSTLEEGYKEVFALKLDEGSGVVERFAQTHNTSRSAQVGVSPDGTKIIFKSDWGDGSAIDDTYQAELK
jgi:hypothetical protein